MLNTQVQPCVDAMMVQQQSGKDIKPRAELNVASVRGRRCIAFKGLVEWVRKHKTKKKKRSNKIKDIAYRKKNNTSSSKPIDVCVHGRVCMCASECVCVYVWDWTIGM